MLCYVMLLLWYTVAESTHKRHLFFHPKMLMSADQHNSSVQTINDNNNVLVRRNNKYNTARRLLWKITAPQTRR